MSRKVDVIVDLQFGSTGKGLIAGYLAKRGSYDGVVNANMPNAGHTFINDNGRKWIHKVLPNGIVSDIVRFVGLGPGSIFSIDQLIKEMEGSSDLMESKKLFIHESAVVVTSRHRGIEQAALKGIASTMQGSAAAMVEKIMRGGGNILAKDVLAGTRFADNVIASDAWDSLIHNARSILLEGAQGYSLGINAGFWPYCTSRDCTPARFLSDCSIPASYLRHTIGTARVHPIRVGSTKDGSSGGHYPDQKEVSWDDIGVPAELTTVTQRQRRVFTPSLIQLRQAIRASQPDRVFLNFMNYNPTLGHDLTIGINDALRGLGPQGAYVAWQGWGPSEEMVSRLDKWGVV